MEPRWPPPDSTGSSVRQLTCLGFAAYAFTFKQICASLYHGLFCFSSSDVECLWRMWQFCHFERPQWRCDGAALQHRRQVRTPSSLSKNTPKLHCTGGWRFWLECVETKCCVLQHALLCEHGQDCRSLGQWDRREDQASEGPHLLRKHLLPGPARASAHLHRQRWRYSQGETSFNVFW